MTGQDYSCKDPRRRREIEKRRRRVQEQSEGYGGGSLLTLARFIVSEAEGAFLGGRWRQGVIEHNMIVGWWGAKSLKTEWPGGQQSTHPLDSVPAALEVSSLEMSIESKFKVSTNFHVVFLSQKLGPEN
eukprot:761429-Hanusia_phi.AAC.1